MTKFDDSPKMVAEIAKKVIINTAERSIPLTPENYHVWFEYFRGVNKELKTAIDSLINSNEYFSEEINQRLYADYLNKEKQEILKEVHKETQKIFQNVFHASLSTNDVAAVYSDKMMGYQSQLNDANELTQIQHLIVNIIKDTNEMAESSNQLNLQLKEATSQIQSLSKQLEETEKEVLLDGLTGLNNRKAFDRKINELCDENIGLFSVIMLDIDYFKKFNDQHGHQIGDSVLSIVGNHLKETLKGKDFPSRYGGEEFIIILPNTKLDKAIIVAEQIRETISAQRLKNKKTGQDLGKITVSLGVSEMRAGDTTATIVERADAALYMAKDSGRNNVKSEKDLELVKTGI